MKYIDIIFTGLLTGLATLIVYKWGEEKWTLVYLGMTIGMVSARVRWNQDENNTSKRVG